MVNYNIESQILDTIPSFEFDYSKTSDYTYWDYGVNNEIESLNLEQPSNTYNNSGFTDYYPAQNYFNIDNYPIRTAVKIFHIVNDTLKQKCSGTLVSKNYVLTDCHCIGEYDSLGTFIFEDSIYIYPAFDNGNENPLWGSTKALEYVTFSKNMNGYYRNDIALIKLEDSLGLRNGWIGIGFNEDETFFGDNVFHKLSYPGTVDIADSTRIYNGDTLYYNYGKLDLIDDEWLGYGINGIGGQSGSSLFYTNNEEYYSLGTQVWTIYSRHIRINREIFYSFKSIIDNTVTSIGVPNPVIDKFYLSNAYPNPFNPVTNIEYIIAEESKVSINVYNLLGELVATLYDGYRPRGTYKVSFDGTKLSSGLYIYVMKANDFIDSKKVLLVK
ncbi:MAG: T9SS type A sorting domain-containing protein [Ignavibacteria bacterium]